jgi:arabinofuranosyltransferase
MRFQRIMLLGALGAAAVLLVLHTRLFWRYTVDDAFISFRYAQNLIDGHGLVYNPGERVEGYSNLAWTLLFALLSLVSAEPVGLAKIVAALLGVLSLPFVMLLVLEATGSAGAAALAALLVAANPYVAAWLVAGLETPLFLFGLVTLAWASSRDLKLWYVIAGAVVCLSRPEGSAVVGALAVCRTLVDRPGRLRLWLFLPLLATAAQLAFRLSYYGQWVPNTAFIKTGGGWAQYRQGVDYLASMFDEWSFRLGLPILCAAPFLMARRQAALSALVLSGTYLAFLIYSGGDYFALYRLVAPILPLMTVIVVATLVEAGRRLSLGRVTTGLVVGIVAVCLVLAPQLKSGPGRLRIWKEQAMMDGFLRPAGFWFRDHSPPGTTIALTVAGAIPYYSGLRTIDRFGLCDAEIARADLRWEDRYYGIAKYDSASVLRRKPEWIMLNLDEATALRFTPEQLVHQAYVPADRDLLSRPEFTENYRLMRAWVRSDNLYQEMALYARKGSAVDPQR